MLAVICISLFVSFVLLFVSLLVSAWLGKDTHIIGKALLGVFIIGVVFAIAIFCYQFQWHEEEYDINNKPYWSRVMNDSISDLIEVYYVRPLLGEGNYWYQTGWYESEDELAQVICCFDDDEEIERFINIVDPSNLITGDEGFNPYEVPVNNDCDVEYYKIDLDEFEFCPMRYIKINYYIAVNQETGEAALAVYFIDT